MIDTVSSSNSSVCKSAHTFLFIEPYATPLIERILPFLQANHARVSKTFINCLDCEDIATIMPSLYNMKKIRLNRDQLPNTMRYVNEDFSSIRWAVKKTTFTPFAYMTYSTHEAIRKLHDSFRANIWNNLYNGKLHKKYYVCERRKKVILAFIPLIIGTLLALSCSAEEQDLLVTVNQRHKDIIIFTLTILAILICSDGINSKPDQQLQVGKLWLQ